jgi:CHAT domain-containing protein/tetratricopeptide (TPR) repeat protein
VKKIQAFLFLWIIFCSVCVSQPWIKADSLRIKYLLRARYDSALYYTNEEAALMRGITGENNLQYAGMLENLAVSHFYLGNFKKAKYFILKEVALRESLKTVDDTGYITCLENASIICRRSGDYEEALTQIKKAEKKSLKVYSAHSPAYAKTLSCYAGVYYDMGCSVNDMVYLKQGEEYLKKAESIYLSNGEKSKNAVIINKSDQAAYNNDIGNLPMAELLLQEVASSFENEYGPSSTNYASALNNLAILYYNSGDYKLAEKFFIEAVGIYKESPESGSIQTGICINNLGALYHDMGNYNIAARLISDAQKILENDAQQNNPAFAVMLNNLASVYLSEEYYANPENKNRERLRNSGEILLRADSVFKINCQNPHPFGFAIMNNLALWYNFTGNIKKSIQMLYDQTFQSNISFKVVALMNKMGMTGEIPITGEPQTHPALEPLIIPIKIKLLDQVIASNADYNSNGSSDVITKKMLEWIFGKATNLKKAVGPYHPAYAEVLKSLIVSYASNDDVEAEEQLTLEYINVINHKTLQDFSFLSESEKELYYQTRLPDMDSFIAYTLSRKRKNPGITCYAYNNILLNKGLMLKSSTAMRVAILNSKDPVLLKEYDEWIALQKEISALYSTPVEMRAKNLSDLEKKANDLEKSLVVSSQDFSDYRKGIQITWEDVRKSLKPDEAAIEFTDFRKREKDGGDAVIYCALVVRPNSEYPEMVKLFTESQLENIIGKNGRDDISYINDIYGTANKQDDRLYDLIWKPIEEYLIGAKNIYISPSGLLLKISFPAISNGKGVYLCDKYQIQVKGSTGNSGEQSNFSIDNNPSALIFGGIKYGQNNPESQVWSYLKGTKDEGDAVNSILGKGHINVSYLSDNSATETYFKQNARKYNILHIATHGFFFADPNEVRFEEKKENVEYGNIAFRGATRGFGVNSFVNNENPLMRSGLVLAGANDVWVKTEKGDSDDGVLTAQEVTQIDMRKNNLVVLSACETGLGDIKGSEGVYGLQRALKMAGVKYIIMSLWEIPDKETVEFMGTFYKNLLQVKNIREAFLETQKNMRAKYDPFYWGAFVLME